MTFERSMRLLVLPATIAVVLWVVVLHIADREKPGSDVTADQVRDEVIGLGVLVFAWVVFMIAWAVRRLRARRGPYQTG